MGTPVTVTVSAGDEEVVLRIANNGPAIQPHDLDQVFEPFVRLAGDDDRAGTGLGLAIARGFAEANGGRVWAESPPGGGAAFGLAFPVAHVPAEVGR
jgi:signal transduction histidine kinase